MPICLRCTAGLMANHLPWPVWPIYNDRKINRAALFHHLPPNPRDIGLLRLAFFKLQTQMTLRVRLQSKDHDARGIAIQPMHQKRRGIIDLNARDQTIGQKRSTPGHRQKTRGLIDQQKFMIQVDHIQRVHRRVICCHAPPIALSRLKVNCPAKNIHFLDPQFTNLAFLR